MAMGSRMAMDSISAVRSALTSISCSVLARCIRYVVVKRVPKVMTRTMNVMPRILAPRDLRKISITTS